VGIEFYDEDMVKKHFQRLDHIISCSFPHLQRLSFELEWWVDSESLETVAIEELLRCAMPVSNGLGIVDFDIKLIVDGVIGFID
jgi:hypothetical protein